MALGEKGQGAARKETVIGIMESRSEGRIQGDRMAESRTGFDSGSAWPIGTYPASLCLCYSL